MDLRLLYLSVDDSGASLLDRLALAGIPIDVTALPPAALTDTSAVDGAAAVVVDGRSLGAQAIDVARRVRWLGFAGALLLAGDSGSELDRAIARESGVDEVLSASLPAAELAARCTRLVTRSGARARRPENRPAGQRDASPIAESA